MSSVPNIIAMAVNVEIEAGSAEAKTPRKFHAVAYTGGPLVLAQYPLPVVVDLAGLGSVKQVIANLDHEKRQRVGHITGQTNDGKSLELSGILSAATPSREEVIASADDGLPWQVSIEAKPTKMITIPAGKTGKANGREFDGPILIARKSTLVGLGFVGQGADENTSATIAAGAASNEEIDMKFENWIEAQGFDTATLNDKQKASLQGAYNAEIKAAAGDENKIVADASFDIDELKAAYASHEAKLEASLFKAAGVVDSVKLSEIKAKAFGDAVELKAEAIEKEWSALQFKVAAIEKLGAVNVALIQAERPTGPAIHASQKDMDNTVIEAALAQTVGLPDLDKHYDAKTLQSAHTAFRGRMGLQQILMICASANGMHSSPGQRINDGNLREVLGYAFPTIRAGQGFTTISLPGVLSSVANKEILTGYMEEDQTWREISQVKSVNNFYAITSYRMMDNLEYEELPPDGQIKHGTLGEETFTRQAKTYARMLALARTDIINDDLGAFDDLRARLGRGSAQKFNKVFWAAFMDNLGSFFTTAHNNYLVGATTTLLTDGVGLGLGLAKFRAMTTPTAAGARRIGGNPQILLVPPELEGAADRLYMGENLNVGSGPGDVNIYRNKYRPVVVPWLSDSAYTGYSATAWYLLRNPALMAAMVVSFLNGNQTPVVESADTDFNTLGIQFRGYSDFGCNQAEYLAGVRVKGAA